MSSQPQTGCVSLLLFEINTFKIQKTSWRCYGSVLQLSSWGRQKNASAWWWSESTEGTEDSVGSVKMRVRKVKLMIFIILLLADIFRGSWNNRFQANKKKNRKKQLKYWFSRVRSPALLILHYFWITAHLWAVINGLLRPSCRKHPAALEQDCSSSLCVSVNWL